MPRKLWDSLCYVVCSIVVDVEVITWLAGTSGIWIQRLRNQEILWFLGDGLLVSPLAGTQQFGKSFKIDRCRIK